MVSFAVYGSDPYGLNFSGNKGFNIQYKSVELYIKKVTLSYEPATKADEDIIKRYGDVFSVPAYLVKMVPVLKIDGNVVARGNEIGLGYRQQFEIGIKSTGQEKEIINNDVIAGSFYNVGFDYQIVAEDELQTIANKLRDSEYTKENVYTDEKMGEILNFVAKSYFAEMDVINKILMQQMNIFSVRQLSEGITGFKANVKYLFAVPVELSSGSLYIDVDSNVNSVVSRSGDKNSEKQYMISSGMVSSALEHSIWEQATGAEAVSTIKVLEVASERNIPVYAITKANYDEYKEKLHLSSSVKDEIKNAVFGGKIVTVASEEIQLGDWSGVGYIIMDPETGSAAYMISGGIAGGASTEEVELAYFVDIAFSIWDFVEAILLIASAAAMLLAHPVIGGIFLVLGIICLLFAIYSYIHTIYLLWEYYNGNEEAGQELINDMKLNIIMTLVTFGLGRILKPIAKAAKKSRIVKVLGEELLETVAKNFDEGTDAIDEIDKVIRSLKKAGASEDVIKEFVEKFNKKGLDWLNAKSAFKFTDNELRKLAGLGDNLFDCSDELLDVFKKSSRQDDIIDAIAKHGKDAADAIASYKDEAAELIAKHGDNAVKAMKNGIDPALVKKLDDLGIDPSKYDELGIVGRESAEAFSELTEFVTKNGINVDRDMLPKVLNELCRGNIDYAERILLSTKQVISGKSVTELVDILNLVEKPALSSLTNYEARVWYSWQKSLIRSKLDFSKPLQEVAREAVDMRNNIRRTARDLMKDQELAQFLDALEPMRTLDELVELYKSRGFSGDSLWNEIINASMRGRGGVDILFEITY